MGTGGPRWTRSRGTPPDGAPRSASASASSQWAPSVSVGHRGIAPPDACSRSNTCPSTSSDALPPALTNRTSAIMDQRPAVRVRSATPPGSAVRESRSGLHVGRHRAFDHLVDEAVVLGLLGREPAIAVEVLLDALHRLAGVQRDALGHHPLQVDDLLGLD